MYTCMSATCASKVNMQCQVPHPPDLEVLMLIAIATVRQSSCCSVVQLLIYSFCYIYICIRIYIYMYVYIYIICIYVYVYIVFHVDVCVYLYNQDN